MKKILLPLFVILFSCSRPDLTSNNNNGDPEISYDLDGKHYEHKGEATITNGLYGAGIFKYPGSAGLLNPYYEIIGLTSVSNSILIFIVTDTLKTIIYRVTKGSNSGITADTYNHILFEDTDFLDVTITDYRNGVINGKFSGNISKGISLNPYVLQPVKVTNGVIKNVKIKYL